VINAIAELQTAQDETAYDTLLNKIKIANNLAVLNNLKNQINNFNYPVGKTKNVLEVA